MWNCILDLLKFQIQLYSWFSSLSSYFCSSLFQKLVLVIFDISKFFTSFHLYSQIFMMFNESFFMMAWESAFFPFSLLPPWLKGASQWSCIMANIFSMVFQALVSLLSVNSIFHFWKYHFSYINLSQNQCLSPFISSSL